MFVTNVYGSGFTPVYAGPGPGGLPAWLLEGAWERGQFVAGTRASSPLIRVATGVAADP